MWTLTRAVAVALGLGVCVGVSAMLPSRSAEDTPPGGAPLETGMAADADTEVDPRIQAFLQAYDALVDSVVYEDGDAVFMIGRAAIHFRDGRMLAESPPERDDLCDPIFYSYPLGPLTTPSPKPAEMPRYCTDLLESLWGNTEREIRNHGRSVRFLDHRMFVNELLVAPLADVERDIQRLASRDQDVAAWVDELDVTYSFSFREIAGSATRSQHSWGLAVDLVPTSYHGRAVYWRWSRALYGEGWDRIPMARRWSPPEPVIEIFERHGFVWGGKWAHYDAIHFEYRPEILLYSRAAEQ